MTTPPPISAPNAVFVSYAREDSAVARRIADALRSHALEVWFDQDELRGGEAWDQKLRRQIKECALFVPVVSANTQERREGYFRLEWKLASERTHLMAEGVPFIAPVVVDDTKEANALVPAEFLRVQWSRLPQGDGGQVLGEARLEAFCEQVKRLLGPVGPGAATPPSPQKRDAGVASPVRPAVGHPVSVAAWAALVLCVVGLGGVFLLTRNPVPTVAAVPPPERVAAKSIAVLPFANMSDEKDSAFFADGMHEDILTNLALIAELRVISRTSVMGYRATTKPMKLIGTELGAAFLLEGSVRRAGNKVRVTGQLIDARTDEHVWAKSYDRDLTDLFAIQASLAQEIAAALQAVITPQTQVLIARRPTEDPVAYDAFLKGRNVRNAISSRQRGPLKQAEALFQTAVERDPKFAAAWGELAVVHALHAFW